MTRKKLSVFVVGRYTFPPCTTKRRITNLKTKSNQNCQKIKLYGSPTTKELKKKHSSRLGGGMEMGSWEGEDMARWQLEDQVGEAVAGSPTSVCGVLNWEEQLGSETDYAIQGSSTGK